ARIHHIDTSQAQRIPGLVKILSYRDIPGKNRFGVLRKDQPYLSEGYVRFLGEPILLVVAESERAARGAAASIQITYGELEGIFSPSTSASSNIKIHEDGNLLCQKKVIRGDIEKGFSTSDLVVENIYETQFLDHAFLECEAGVGFIDELGRIVIISSTQNVHYKRKEVSTLLALPEEKIRVIQATTGGGFGGKLDMTVEGYLALAVYHTKRPVMIRYTRSESMLVNTKRHPLTISYKTGVTKDGRLTAIQVRVVGDTGAYASYGEVVAQRAAVHASGPYEVPNVYVESLMYYTNNPTCGAMRGFGIPQMAFAHESQMDEIARLLGIDPLQIRLINGLKRGSSTITGQRLTHSVGYIHTLKAIEPFWRDRRKGEWEGYGLGSMYYGIGNTGVPNPSSCYLTLREDGKIGFHLGACEIGQGSDTVLFQILLQTLSVGPESVELIRADTDLSKDAGSTSASRQTYITGKAVQGAGEALKGYLEEKGFYRGRSLKEIYLEAKEEGRILFEGFFDPPTTPLDPQGQGIPYATYAFATHMTKVEIEPATMRCRVKKVIAAHDVGRAVNPVNVRGQIYGGIAMGIGLALMEEFVPGKTLNLNNYYVPTIKDMPEVETILIEDPEPTGPYGAKGVGEPALIPQAASIVNAIRDATGMRVLKLPCNFERLWLQRLSGGS
ncbi:MAG: xanthine dehydrogenase family protein molybdopterin-binding subunit, partial [Desulfatiglandales bacterium]